MQVKFALFSTDSGLLPVLSTTPNVTRLTMKVQKRGRAGPGTCA